MKFNKILTKQEFRKCYVGQNISKAEIARKYKTTIATINKYMKMHDVKTNSHPFKSLEGKKFGRLLVIKRSKNDKHQKIKWVCRCDCGQQKIINAASLIRRLSLSCGCLRSEKARTGFKDISGSFWRRCVEQAKARGMEFSITPLYVWKIYKKQKDKCALSGLPIYFDADSNKPENRTASIDRINSCRGYVRKNIQIVHKLINMSKSWLDQKEFVAICNLVASNWRMKNEDCVHRIITRIARKI